MTSHETAIADRLRDAADRIPVDTTLMPMIEVVRDGAVPRSRLRPRRRAVTAGLAAIALASAAALVVVVVMVVVVGSDPTPETVRAGTAPTGVPAQQVPDACLTSRGLPPPCSSSPAAHVADPPAWFGEPRSAFRSGYRTGRWMSMAIGRAAADVVTDPIVVSVFDGTDTGLADAEEVTIDGTPLRSLQFGDWRVLATNETPTVMVMGEVDETMLKAVLDSVEVADPIGELSFQLRSHPDGYSEIVPPRLLGPDYEFHRTLAGELADVGINEVSDCTDPLLCAAMSGEDLSAVDIGGTTGWIGRATTNPHGPVRFLVWSPRPGVVFEITTSDMQRSRGDLVELARGTSTLDPADWDATYGD